MSRPGEIKIFDNARDVTTNFADLLANWPLYKIFAFRISNPTVAKWQSFIFFPEQIRQYCNNTECETITIWETSRDPGIDQTGLNSKIFKCRHCKQSEVIFYYVWRVQSTIEGRDVPAMFYKIGQYPALDERVPQELVDRLDHPDLTLYRKSIGCRNQAMGLGAVAYLRRVVENKINLLLDELAEEATKYGFELETLKKLEEAKKSWRFSEKIKFASLILPPSLRPGGHNPIDQLHDLASEGVHYLSDDDSLELYDECRPVFEYLFREIDSRRRSAADYAQSLAKLATSRKSKNS
jgi:hypothetical protein